MGSVRFTNADMKMVLATNSGGDKYRCSFGTAIRSYEKATGKKYDFNVEMPKEYFETDKPIVSFVKDSGIYIMAAKIGGEKQFDKPTSERTDLAYAVGYSPDAENSWERCVEAVGGDDFVEDIDATLLQKCVDMGLDILVSVSATTMTVKGVPPKKMQKKVIPFGDVRGVVVLSADDKIITLQDLNDKKEAYILIKHGEKIIPNKGDIGTITFTKGGPAGGYWKWKPTKAQ